MVTTDMLGSPARFTGLLPRARVLAFAVAMVLVAGCGGVGPEAPSVAPSRELIAGVAWYDDNGNGRIDGGEESARGLAVRMGQDSSTFGTTKTMTNDRGGFEVAVLEELPDIDLDLFVEVEMLAEGPSGVSIPVHHRVDADRGDVRIEVPLRRPVGCETTVEELVAGAEECGAVLLPDLVPIVEDFGQGETTPIAQASAYLDSTTLPGRDLLRFASATANLGAGPLHMIPDASPSGARIGTWQRLWTATGTYVDHRTGSFIFHEGHDHFHLESFEQYRLLSVDGEVVRTGEKISFCLIDSLPMDEAVHARGAGIYLDAVCEEAGEQQALNPGWADYYGAGLPDQWIDVTGVAPGEYVVEIVVDPEGFLLESDESNNRATFAVMLDFGTASDE